VDERVPGGAEPARDDYDLLMRSSKLQHPSSRETSSTKLQAAPLVDGWHSVAGVEPLMLKDDPSSDAKPRHAFDLEERTTAFGEAIVRFSKRIPRHPTNDRLISQIVGCGTAIGANYCEANEGVSKKDFRCRIGTCVKEAKETKYFLRMIVASEPQLVEDARKLYREAKELHLIFASIFRK
jgi:four helix bundle protein